MQVIVLLIILWRSGYAANQGNAYAPAARRSAGAHVDKGAQQRWIQIALAVSSSLAGAHLQMRDTLAYLPGDACRRRTTVLSVQSPSWPTEISSGSPLKRKGLYWKSSSSTFLLMRESGTLCDSLLRFVAGLRTYMT